MSIQTKNEIKNRMVKKAAELWGVSPNDIDSTFDPVISLLIGACATELSKISSELNSSQSRITEKLIQLMTPETSFGAQPAHAIAYAHPTEATADVYPAHQLYAKNRFKNSEGEVSFKTAYFSPIKPFKLINTHIKAGLVGSQFISYDDSRKSLEIDNLILNDKSLKESTFYLGIKPTKEKVSLKDVSLFFELNDVGNQELFYNQLKQADFFFNDNPIDVEFGYANNSSEERIHLQKVFSEQSQKTVSIEQQSLLFYKRHYVSVNSDVVLNSPNEDLSFLENIDLKKHEDLSGLNWIKIVFPSIVTNKVLSNLFVSFNTFPVLNRRLETTSYQLKEFANIVPFSTTDLFLDIRKITNDSGKVYSILDDDDKDKKGSYTLRDESVGRLDSRKAKDYLISLIDLLKNESAAFSVLGSEFLQTSINKLNQDISALESRVSEMSLQAEENHYLSVKPYNKKETVFIDFWSTIGESANLIRSNTSLQVYKGSDINTQKCFLITATSQGKDTLSITDRLNKYRRVLLSRERIVTREDVKALCYDICGDKIENVTLNKEFVVSNDYHKGLLPTLVVQLTKNKKVNVQDIEWEMIKSNILSILEEKSTNLLPYKIKVN